MLKKNSIIEHCALLDSACQWMALDKGRATEYRPLIEEFVNGARKREHILAFGESSEIIDLFNMWESRIDDFPLLKGKMRDVFGKGPLFREDENLKASGNAARNNAFAFLVAGKLQNAGIPVVAVEGICAGGAVCQSNADLTIRWKDQLINFECKRPQTEAKLETRAKKARDQLRRSARNARLGVIAIDCSVIIRPADTVYENTDVQSSELKLSTHLEKVIYPKIHKFLDKSILGFILFSRVPAMTRLPIVTSTNESIYRPDCITSWLFVGNSRCPAQNYLKDLSARL